MIHGGIDGYSRKIVYIHCSTNNRAETVMSLFAGQVQTTPEAIALHHALGAMTYAELDKESDKVAAFLIKQGFGHGSLGVSMMTAAFAIFTWFVIVVFVRLEHAGKTCLEKESGGVLGRPNEQ